MAASFCSKTCRPMCVFVRTRWANDVRDPDRIGRYLEAVRPVTERHGGTYLAVDLSPTAVEGSAPLAVVVIEFADAERLRAWYDGDDYAPLKAERRQVGDFTFLLVDGL